MQNSVHHVEVIRTVYQSRAGWYLVSVSNALHDNCQITTVTHDKHATQIMHKRDKTYIVHYTDLIISRHTIVVWPTYIQR